NDRGHEVLAAEGYEFERTCGAPDSDMVWNERVMVVRSPMHATQQAAGLETRLRHAETKLAALTPPRGRGKRQITDEATLLQAIERVVTEECVEVPAEGAGVEDVERPVRDVGGRHELVQRPDRGRQKARELLEVHVGQLVPLARRLQRLV